MFLVGGVHPSEKYDSVGVIFPNIYGKNSKTHVPVTTNQNIIPVLSTIKYYQTLFLTIINQVSEVNHL